ncbi:MAG TPA: DMT family transporter, partial [Alphaproteobacteria bacterium]|nr:DMT family transporter [Alphaproteobacteria bacterium]
MSPSLADLAPVLLALSSGFLFALALQVLNLGLRYADPETGSLIHITSTTVFYWLLAPWFIQSAWWLTGATLIFGAVGLFRPLLSANLALNGVRHLGPTLTSTLAATSPLFGLIFGVVLLHEAATLPVLLGTAGIMGGIIVLARRNRAKASAANWPVWALALPLGAAFFRAS